MEKMTGVQEETSRLKHNLYVGIGDYRKAAQELEKLIASHPDDLSFRHALATFYEQINDKANANKVYQQILKDFPDDSRAKLALAGQAKPANEEQFLQSLKPVFENPGVNIDLKIKEILPLVNRLAEGKAKELGTPLTVLVEKLIAAHPKEAKAFAVAGDVYYHNGQTDKALTAYQKTLEIDRSVWTVWEQVLFIHFEKNNFLKLLEYSEIALDFFPNQALVYLMNARALNAMSKGQNALSSAQQALMMVGTNATLKQQVLVETGVAWYLQKNIQKSDAAFEDALILNPNNPNTLKQYAICLASRKEGIEKAKGIAEQLNRSFPDNPGSETVIGVVLYHQKDYENAKNRLLKAIKFGDPVAFEYLGNTFFHLEQPSLSVQYWQLALEKTGPNPELEKKIASGKLIE
jgi:tetratricopeptide (TPR) repeat protein